MVVFESPWLILFIGIVVEAILAVALLNTRRGVLLWWMIGVAAVVLLGVAIERLVVTDREAVRNTLDECVAASVANDLPRLLQCVSSSAERVRNDARTALEWVEVRSGNISDVEITVNRSTGEPTAEAQFRIVVRFRDRRGQIPYEAFVDRMTVRLRLEGKQWRVSDYSLAKFSIPGPSRNSPLP